ncbi:MAG TPA: LacI family DNA-binding transcriptional regulator, partial [Propionibacteriaceae bacterium]
MAGWAGARPPGMQDVARVAGVSHQTVSRVLNGHPRVRAETRARVLAVIADLGYRRNPAARALVTSRSRTIGVLAPRSGLFGPVSTLVAVEVAARTAGLFVSVASLDHFDAGSVTAALDHFLDQHVEGVIVIAPM